jgi:hypothetical protein
MARHGDIRIGISSFAVERLAAFFRLLLRSQSAGNLPHIAAREEISYGAEINARWRVMGHP